MAEKAQLFCHLSDLSAFWTEVGPFPLCADICSSPVLLLLSSSPLHFVIAFCFTGLLHPSPCSFPSTSLSRDSSAWIWLTQGAEKGKPMVCFYYPVLLIPVCWVCLFWDLGPFKASVWEGKKKRYETSFVFCSSYCSADLLGYSEFGLCGFSHPDWSCRKNHLLNSTQFLTGILCVILCLCSCCLKTACCEFGSTFSSLSSTLFLPSCLCS